MAWLCFEQGRTRLTGTLIARTHQWRSLWSVLKWQQNRTRHRTGSVPASYTSSFTGYVHYLLRYRDSTCHGVMRINDLRPRWKKCIVPCFLVRKPDTGCFFAADSAAGRVVHWYALYLVRAYKGSTLTCRLRFSWNFQNVTIDVWKNTQAQNLLQECIFFLP